MTSGHGGWACGRGLGEEMEPSMQELGQVDWRLAGRTRHGKATGAIDEDPPLLASPTWVPLFGVDYRGIPWIPRSKSKVDDSEDDDGDGDDDDEMMMVNDDDE